MFKVQFCLLVMYWNFTLTTALTTTTRFTLILFFKILKFEHTFTYQDRDVFQEPYKNL